MDVSIVILNYKSRELALNCLGSIMAADFPGIDREIFLVDNGSRDGIGNIVSDKYPEVNFIANKKNIGMGAGNNLGIVQAKGKYIAIMNPDIVAEHDTFFKLFKFMEESLNVGVVGPKQFNLDGSVQDSCYRWHSLFTPIFRRTPLGKLKYAQLDEERFLMKDFDHNSQRDVDWLLGSFLFCRANALREIGMFDERFFLYFEDTDLCRRFWQDKWRVVYFPDAKIIHNHNRASAKAPWYGVFTTPAGRYHLESWAKYILKWRFK